MRHQKVIKTRQLKITKEKNNGPGSNVRIDSLNERFVSKGKKNLLQKFTTDRLKGSSG